MKQQRNTTILREIHHHTPSQSQSQSPSPSPSPSPSLSKLSYRKQQHILSSKENTPPPPSPPPSPPSPLPSDSSKVPPIAIKMKSPLPPRPPNPHKRKILDAADALPVNPALHHATDSGVQVIVRMRPPKNDQEQAEAIVNKISPDSLSINGQTFTFDSIADVQATQLHIFQLVGLPLVDNCLAGFNSSVFAYGQTGSGKTYTIWGPTNAMSEHNLFNDQQGLTPRVFHRLFSRINEEQIKHADKQLKYKCRCSFLEIYNEQITDLLDPSQKNLQIREDVKSGVYVENLTEDCVSTMRDVTQLLLKGLSNRRTGATSINSESSRSHSVFTCVVESHCKNIADGVSSVKTSRINLVDLAGSERQKLTGAAGDRLKEAGNINRSLSQLGNLINILAEVSQTGKQRHIPYRDSRLTFLLQDSLGGNAKLTMVCAISPSQSCKSETFSTLRFAQRAKAIKNKAVVNEIMQDDVNVLREVIRGLKDELLRMKANRNPTDSNGGYSTGWNARRSLNLLKFSINRQMKLAHIDDDGDTEMEIDEERGDKDFVQLESHILASRDGIIGEPKPNPTGNESSNEKILVGIDVMQEVLSERTDKHKNTIIRSEIHHPNLSKADMSSSIIQIEGDKKDQVCLIDGEKPAAERNLLIASDYKVLDVESPSKHNGYNQNQISTDISAVTSSNHSPNGLVNCATSLNLNIAPCDVSIVKSPIRSVSPKVINGKLSQTNKSLSDLKEDSEVGPDSIQSMNHTSNSLAIQKSKNFSAPTEHLAASLHRGLDIIDSHRQNLSLRRSSFRFSLRPVDHKPMHVVNKVNVGVQTLHQDNEISQEDSVVYLCSNCKGGTSQPEPREFNDISNLQIVPVDGSVSADKLKKQVPKAVEKVLAGAIRREMALEEICSKQTAEITQLNRIVQQYRHERECNAIIGQTREDKIVRLECLMDGVLPTDDFMEEEFISLRNEHKLLNEKYENHPEVLRTKVELKRVQDELEQYRNFHDMGERDVLLEEIQDLRSQLHCYMDSSASRKRSPPLQLTYSCEPSLPPPLCVIPETSEENSADKFEQERLRWTDTESKWISLVEELRMELEANRSLADKQKQELDCEKKCAEELKEAMQMAMEGHARMLEQYAELQENYIALLARQRKIHEGIDDVKKAAAKAGVRGAESKFINALAAEISALKGEQEKERRYFRDEIKGLQAQLRDTAEAVQAAGELLVRLKEAEEVVAAAQDRAVEAEEETEKAYNEIDKLKNKHEKEMKALKQRLSEYRVWEKNDSNSKMAKYDVEENHSSAAGDDEQWRDEFEAFYKKGGEVGESSKVTEASSWFSGYDRCNI